MKSIYAKPLGNDAPTARVLSSGSSAHQWNRGSRYQDTLRSLLYSTLLMKFIGVSSSAAIVLPSTRPLLAIQDTFPIVNLSQSSVLLPSCSTATSSTVALPTLSNMASPVFAGARHQRICQASWCLWPSMSCLRSSVIGLVAVLIAMRQVIC